MQILFYKHISIPADLTASALLCLHPIASLYCLVKQLLYPKGLCACLIGSVMPACITCKGPWDLPHRRVLSLIFTTLPYFLKVCQSLILSELPLSTNSFRASRGEISSNISTDLQRNSKVMAKKIWMYLKKEGKFLWWWCSGMFCSWLSLPFNFHSVLFWKEKGSEIYNYLYLFLIKFIGIHPSQEKF